MKNSYTPCMADSLSPTTLTISVFTRHSAECSKKEDPTWRRCNCRKSLYLYENGKKSYLSARTRSWEQAEKVAQAERDKRDPVKLRLKEIEAEETAKAAAEQARAAMEAATVLTIPAAIERWILGMKKQSISTEKGYKYSAKKIVLWAADSGIETLHDVTSDLLDRWRSEWGPEADKPYNRMRGNTQAQLVVRIKLFFRWAHRLKLIPEDPARYLETVPADSEPTLPLTPAQFDQLLEATYKYDADLSANQAKRGAALRAIFLTQRWTGLRIGDVLMLPRAALQGNRLILSTQKTKAKINRLVPDVVVEALTSLPPLPSAHPDYFFWSKTSSHISMSSYWSIYVAALNPYLNFKDEDGKPMAFHSHMLRDTFAVEMLNAGLSLEYVSRLLTHSSITTTEQHYAPWVKSREQLLEEALLKTMRGMGVTVSTGQVSINSN